MADLGSCRGRLATETGFGAELGDRLGAALGSIRGTEWRPPDLANADRTAPGAMRTPAPRFLRQQDRRRPPADDHVPYRLRELVARGPAVGLLPRDGQQHQPPEAEDVGACSTSSAFME